MTSLASRQSSTPSMQPHEASHGSRAAGRPTRRPAGTADASADTNAERLPEAPILSAAAHPNEPTLPPPTAVFLFALTHVGGLTHYPAVDHRSRSRWLSDGVTCDPGLCSVPLNRWDPMAARPPAHACREPCLRLRVQRPAADRVRGIPIRGVIYPHFAPSGHAGN